MKIKINKESFIKSWSLTERSAGTPSSMNIFSSVRMKADENGVEMQSTDIKTSVICKASGVDVIEPGEAVIPTKGVSDLFKKAGSSEFTIQVDEGKALMISGRSRYRFTTYATSEFPKLPSSSGGSFFCSINASVLSSSIDRGTLCSSPNDQEFPHYLSAVYFEIDSGCLNIVSTDKRRLALSRTEMNESGEGRPLLLPFKGIKELQKILGMIEHDTEVRIIYDDAQAYFTAPGVEFAVRKVESNFPAYARILPTSSTTTTIVDRLELTSAIERVDVVVRDYNKVAILDVSKDGDCVISGRAPEFGEAVETIACSTVGEPIKAGFNTKFFMDAVKVLDGPSASLSFNGPGSHMLVRASDSDSFLCMVAPLELSREEIDTEDVAENAHRGDVL
ncbi:MAG: DNA polymerase III subunit beta [Synergistaceae bacterium]|jgi:DNA polymerase-3 subunit beta|nr:DNA polymerase III subunit beta [Synergistaceae bacterium]